MLNATFMPITSFNTDENEQLKHDTRLLLPKILNKLLNKHNAEKWLTFIQDQTLRSEIIKHLTDIIKTMKPKALKNLFKKQNDNGIIQTIIQFIYLKKTGEYMSKIKDDKAPFIALYIRITHFINSRDNTLNLNDMLTYPEQKNFLFLSHILEIIEPLSNHQIERLILTNNTLSEIPQQISNLQYLKYLDISNNNIIISPKQILYLPRLQDLYLDRENYNQLIKCNALFSTNEKLKFHPQGTGFSIPVSQLLKSLKKPALSQDTTTTTSELQLFETTQKHSRKKSG